MSAGTNILVAVLALFLALPRAVLAGGAPAPAKPVGLAPDRTSLTLQAGTSGSASAAGIDINASYLLTNAGIVARSWSARGDASRQDLGLFMGIGLADVFQVQAGYLSTTGFRLRLRSDLPVTLSEDAWNRFRKGKYWVVTPVFELPLTAHHGVVYGLGLGYAF